MNNKLPYYAVIFSSGKLGTCRLHSEMASIERYKEIWDGWSDPLEIVVEE
jgi:hypothetical protein